MGDNKQLLMVCLEKMTLFVQHFEIINQYMLQMWCATYSLIQQRAAAEREKGASPWLLHAAFCRTWWWWAWFLGLSLRTNMSKRAYSPPWTKGERPKWGKGKIDIMVAWIALTSTDITIQKSGNTVTFFGTPKSFPGTSSWFFQTRL